MRPSKHGANISVNIENITPFGLWLFVNGHEFFLSYQDYPYFKDQTTEDYRLEAGRFESRLKARLGVFYFEFLVFFLDILRGYVFHDHFIGDVTRAGYEKSSCPEMSAPALAFEMAVFL